MFRRPVAVTLPTSTNCVKPRFVGTLTRSGSPLGDTVQPLGVSRGSPGQRICLSVLALPAFRSCVIPNSGVQNPTVLAPLPMMFTTSYAGGWSCPSTSLNLPASPSNVVLRTALRSAVPVADTPSRSRSVSGALVCGVWNAGPATPADSAAAAIAHAVSYAQNLRTVGSRTSSTVG
ncbi:Os02g0787700 [Oryza sativa Japonica Group]|uniref:Os02g0787700 protein n=2 Tax=Oryza sativa subsp. japonica TaxID=39947 RepID=Q0DWY0_ORYSJ|nr:hypothetical protein EE612_014137 [Oryza sativa]BAD19857.1 unknown protein [Oryza sativa Japonica Group]BAF10258.1 Os02g0787700 [Oryza sativa Japonica Group]BAS81289.1 Os02g0787700 [Oryza sativa Japonica Group]|eukprot:NP_001048344.1 Os02g0787700 [Oryza sativa Japonica Group]